MSRDRRRRRRCRRGRRWPRAGIARGAARALRARARRAARARAPRGSSPRPPTRTRSTSRWACGRSTRWRRIEAETGEKLLHETGVVSVGEFAERQLPALRAAGERRRADRRRRGARPLRRSTSTTGGRSSTSRTPGSFAPIARVRRCSRLAVRAGVSLRERETAIAIEDRGDRVAVATDRGRWACETAIVAAGPWSRPLLAEARDRAAADRQPAVGRLPRARPTGALPRRADRLRRRRAVRAAGIRHGA